MKNSTLNKVVTAVLTLVLSASTAGAHSGRTDSNGGHRDNKNASGLGSYHYHCGGYPAHLHSNGVCPYSGSGSSYSSGTSAAPAPAPAPVVKATPCLKIGTIKTFINGNEVPTFVYSETGKAYVLAEDLSNYGFDVLWNPSLNNVTVVKNTGKAITPINMSYYKSCKVGTKIIDVINGNTTVTLKNNINDYGYQPVCYSCNGYMALNIDDLTAFAVSYNWDSSTSSLYINI